MDRTNTAQKDRRRYRRPALRKRPRLIEVVRGAASVITDGGGGGAGAGLSAASA